MDASVVPAPRLRPNARDNWTVAKHCASNAPPIVSILGRHAMAPSRAKRPRDQLARACDSVHDCVLPAIPLSTTVQCATTGTHPVLSVYVLSARVNVSRDGARPPNRALRIAQARDTLSDPICRDTPAVPEEVPPSVHENPVHASAILE